MENLNHIAKKIVAVLKVNCGETHAAEKAELLKSKDKYRTIISMGLLDNKNLSDVAKLLHINVKDLKTTIETLKKL